MNDTLRRSDDRIWPIKTLEMHNCYDSCNYILMKQQKFRHYRNFFAKQSCWRDVQVHVSEKKNFFCSSCTSTHSGKQFCLLADSTVSLSFDEHYFISTFHQPNLPPLLDCSFPGIIPISQSIFFFFFFFSKHNCILGWSHLCRV